jgi:adenylate cyclase
VAYVLVTLGVLVGLCADVAYSSLQVAGEYQSGNPADVGLILSYVLIGAAGLHPSMRVSAEPALETAPTLSRLRLMLLAAATLVAPVVLLLRSSTVAVVAAAVLGLLVVARLAGIVGRHERAVARESRLRTAAATLVGATSPEEIYDAAVETAVAFAGGGPASATLEVEAPAGPREVASAGAPAADATVESVFRLVVYDEARGALEVRTLAPLALEERYALETLSAQVALALESAARARERAERRSEARFRSLVQNSTDVIAIVDRDSAVRYVTPSVAGVLGYAADELVGSRLAELVHAEDAERARAALAEATEAGSVRSGLELRLRHRDGSWLQTETVLNPRLDDEDVGGIVLTTRDVTTRKQLEASQAERERVRDVFARFVPEAVVEQLLAHPELRLRLGGETVNGTIMFTDLRGFTTYSEGLPAEEVIEVINQFLSEQTDTIMGHGGTLVSYLGDGVLAAFGAPIEQADHAQRALAASRELIAERLPLLNEWMRERGKGDGFRMGIGLNSGRFISGNVGHERRLEYTAIGDVCNTAARIQDLTKGTRHMLLFSDSTRATLAHQPDDLVEVGEFDIRGRHAAVRLWSLEDVSDSPTV